jgi:uncharacterized protein (DUF433 family)
MASRSSNMVIAAFTEEQTARLSGITVNKLRYWDRTGFFHPSFAAENRRVAYSRIYSFTDVAALRVLAVLINQYSVPVQHLRKVAERLCSMDNSAWARTELFVLKKRVNFIDPEDGKQREVVSGQYAIGIPLDKVVADTKRDIENLSKRQPDQIGEISRNKYVAGNAAVVAGTRITVDAILAFADEGYSIDQIIKEYPSLSEADIKAAIEYGKAA